MNVIRHNAGHNYTEHCWKTIFADILHWLLFPLHGDAGHFVLPEAPRAVLRRDHQCGILAAPGQSPRIHLLLHCRAGSSPLGSHGRTLPSLHQVLLCRPLHVLLLHLHLPGELELPPPHQGGRQSLRSLLDLHGRVGPGPPRLHTVRPRDETQLPPGDRTSLQVRPEYKCR